MTNAFILIGSTALVSAQSIIRKYYNVKVKGGGVFTFSAISVLAACLFFLLTSGGNLSFTPEIIPYSLGFAISYGTATVFTFLSIKTGSLSLTSLVTSYSLVIPTFYSLLFLGESVSVFFWLGFALLVVSIFLINGKRDKAVISLRWVVFLVLAFVGNGVCSTVQAAEQRAFDGAYKNEFMILALLTVSVALIAISLFTEKSSFIPSLKGGAHLMAACGVANGATNLFVMILVSSMQASIVFPVISGGGIILTWIISKFLYKEALTRNQNIALILGIASVVLMNL